MKHTRTLQRQIISRQAQLVHAMKSDGTLLMSRDKYMIPEYVYHLEEAFPVTGCPWCHFFQTGDSGRILHVFINCLAILDYNAVVTCLQWRGNGLGRITGWALPVWSWYLPYR